MNIKLRPLERLLDSELASPIGDKQAVDTLLRSESFVQIKNYFDQYPAHSFMSHTSRAMLYALVRVNKPHAVAEIGTLFTGTTEVFARALWENASGVVYTCDPAGADRCPLLFAQWPRSLQDIVRFYPVNSMAFFQKLKQERVLFDMILIDGNHDYEFALFDLIASSYMLRPGGIVIMDNAEQSGPFFAARQFIRDNAGWCELGDALSTFNWDKTFNPERASVPHTTFLILKAPTHLIIGEAPWSSGQRDIAECQISGLQFNIGTLQGSGELQYQVILRAFRDEHREIHEYRHIGRIPLSADSSSQVIESNFESPLISKLQEMKGDCSHTLELELAWKSRAGSESITLLNEPQPIHAA